MSTTPLAADHRSHSHQSRATCGHQTPLLYLRVPSAAIGSTSLSNSLSGCRPVRWLRGTSRVPPFSAVKSTNIHMTLTTTAGAIIDGGPASSTSRRSRVIDPAGKWRAIASSWGRHPPLIGVQIHRYAARLGDVGSIARQQILFAEDMPD